MRVERDVRVEADEKKIEENSGWYAKMWLGCFS